MYLVDPSALSPDLWAMMRSAMQLLQHGLLCLTAFSASANVLANAAQAGVQGVSAQYLLGLGIGDITGPVVETNMMKHCGSSLRESARTLRI
ncbi:hypothetical protein K466DRAFT_668585 [Polyporus arcularius HHB13444]|uniref:Uncharacterized protein n=1 Tax=Polyporus arcularius HHB13444 TaxID=1314778 RepID=A0A5C3NLN3_9APHY|nr:hypothetical protein K466DRAFT_668585 [Polyporus arcularius HHB13444]